jgi:hypothetical protein
MEQTQQTDAVEEYFQEDSDGASEESTEVNDNEKAGQEDVAGKSDSLSLEDLNKTFGREFKTKEEALKHAENLKSFAGDQEAIKERKAQKELEEQKKKGQDALSRVETLEKEIAKKDFLIDVPTAKPVLEALEAYAEKQGISLSEAWSSEAFKPIAEASQRISKAPVTNNRINPVQSQAIDKLKEEVKTTGSDTAKIKLVSEYFKK